MSVLLLLLISRLINRLELRISHSKFFSSDQINKIYSKHRDFGNLQTKKYISESHNEKNLRLTNNLQSYIIEISSIWLDKIKILNTYIKRHGNPGSYASCLYI